MFDEREGYCLSLAREYEGNCVVARASDRNDTPQLYDDKVVPLVRKCGEYDLSGTDQSQKGERAP